ncbi:large ribosomal subunit protein uL10m [Culicoides brevitarsis]|uniref:large ribosomal subunit protein uL10m n=1 Tax=Culicoides brevitarsis TaxID=469753 RepID=UPI00307C2ACA
MSQVLPKVLLRSSTPQLQFLRFRGKINIQRPQKNSYEKARFLAATMPVLPKPAYNQRCIDYALRDQKMKEVVDNPYNLIIAREVRNWFDHSQMICIFHLNPISQEDLFNAQVAFHKQGMKLKSYGKKILQLAIGGSKYETILPLFDTKHCIVFSPEIKVNQVLKIIKKHPQMILMAGIAYDRYLSKNELVALGTMPDLQTQRAQFAALLQSAGQQVVSNLQQHQTQLCSLLDMHAMGSEQTTAKSEAPSEAKTEEVKEKPADDK